MAAILKSAHTMHTGLGINETSGPRVLDKECITRLYMIKAKRVIYRNVRRYLTDMMTQP